MKKITLTDGSYVTAAPENIKEETKVVFVKTGEIKTKEFISPRSCNDLALNRNIIASIEEQ